MGQSGLLTRAVAVEMPGTRRVLTRVDRSEGLREEYLDAEHMKDEQKFTSWRITPDSFASWGLLCAEMPGT